MALINSLVSVIIAALSGMGIGGGGLLVIYLCLVMSSEQLKAQGINLAFFLLASVSALSVHLKKRDINFDDVKIISTLGVLSSILGSYLATIISTEILRKIFGGMLIISGIITLFKKQKR